MGINLQKGQKIDLTKGGGGLRQVMVGLGWDEAEQPRGFLHLSRNRLIVMHLLFCVEQMVELLAMISASAVYILEI